MDTANGRIRVQTMLTETTCVSVMLPIFGELLVRKRLKGDAYGDFTEVKNYQKTF
jgi:hypothetical protein